MLGGEDHEDGDHDGVGDHDHENYVVLSPETTDDGDGNVGHSRIMMIMRMIDYHENDKDDKFEYVDC